MDACTIVARNYLPYARTLAQSLAAVHPTSRLTVLVIDGAAEASDARLFRSLAFEDVVPDPEERQRLAFIYDVTELSTAVKPLLLRRLLREGAESVLYFDPDIQVFDSLASLWEAAARGSVILTPHVLSPVPDDGFDLVDISVLRAGIYNLGFIGVGPGSEEFLEWWWGRLRRYCVSDPGAGLFVDQRWVDFIGALFPHSVVRDPGCNVAYWNLFERRVTREGAGYQVNGVPLRFFHFSGFDPAAPHLLSRHQGGNPRILLSEHPVLKELCDAHAARLRANGFVSLSVDYGYATLPDGTPIDMMVRGVYREALMCAERAGAPLPPAPFEGDAAARWLREPAPETPRLSRYALALYRLRLDLRNAFPSTHGEDAERYLNWLRNDPWARANIPAAFRPEEPELPIEGSRLAAQVDGLNVVGYFSSELGVGEAARLLTTAARDAGIPVAAICNDHTLSRQQDGFDVAEAHERYGVTLVCANADECARTLDRLPREMVDDAYRVGLWFWETEQLPREYEAASELLDEIWVASDYVAQAVRKTVTRPVHVCPLPLRTPDPALRTRSELGVPEGFMFLFAFDFLSEIERKNPIGTIQAFRRAFTPGEGPTLVLKSINGALARIAVEEVRAAIGDRPDIILKDEYLPARERDALVGHCDCYVSLHRAEGFGLTLVEAMALGKPTIATGYSGNLAFMTKENSLLVPWRPAFVPPGCRAYREGDRWAEPDIAEAAALMRAVVDNPILAREKGERARADVTRQLAPERTAAFLRERLAAIEVLRRPEPLPDPVPEPAPVVAEPPPFAPLLAARLENAERELAEAQRMVCEGIPFETPSRFGWPGRLLRTVVMRLLRPYAQFEARTQLNHLRSTAEILASLREIGAHLAPPGAGPGKETTAAEPPAQADRP